eukprot:7137730-Prymnesium_polylepis.1
MRRRSFTKCRASTESPWLAHVFDHRNISPPFAFQKPRLSLLRGEALLAPLPLVFCARMRRIRMEPEPVETFEDPGGVEPSNGAAAPFEPFSPPRPSPCRAREGAR